MKIKSILITGGSGYTGSNLAKYALSLGFDVTILHRSPLKETYLKNVKKQITFFSYDNTFKSLDQVFKKKKIDIVFHIAALSQYNTAPEKINDLIDANINFGTMLLEAMTNNNCCYLINTGSYWQNSLSKNYTPNSLYAATKESFQNIIDFYVSNRKLAAITLKPYDIYGPKDKRAKIFGLIKQCYQDKKSLDMTKGEQKVNLIHIDDLVRAYIDALKFLKLGIHKKYFIGSNHLYTLKEIVETFMKITQQKVKINWGGKKYIKNQIMTPYVGTSLPNFKIKFDLKKGLTTLKKEK